MAPKRRGYALRRRCPWHAPGVLYVLHDDDYDRLYLECDEVEHGYWDPELLTEIPFNPDTGIGARRLANEEDLAAAGWDLTLFEQRDPS